MTGIGRYLGATRKTRLGRGRFEEDPGATVAYSLDLLDWDQLNVAIDDLCATFNDAQSNVRPIDPSLARPDQVP